MHKSGLIIHQLYHFLAGSPDGLVFNPVNKEYTKLIEIKCLPRFAGFTKNKLLKDIKVKNKTDRILDFLYFDNEN